MGDTKRGPGRWRSRGWDSPAVAVATLGREEAAAAAGCDGRLRGVEGALGRLRGPGCADITRGGGAEGRGVGKGERGDCGGDSATPALGSGDR